ncbi:SCO family protein [Fodinibius sp.]|uniref:SCO family protein n=1 Tax=Fodinibius sp. TaxID=1872440 RepID=UPI002ACDE37B|nr:SCO family protein [Fodinibius sp.]MDZ7658308.1 SCO family protein [Fodinibius sp.]
MSSTLKSLLVSLFIIAGLTACGPDALYDLSGDTYQLRDSDSTLVNFPGDFKGDISLVTFIYTNCPDVCPVITANMTNIQRKLDDTTGVNFIEITFDPERDTPSVLKEYRNLYGLNEQFTMLTSHPRDSDTLLNKLDIVAEKTIIDSLGYDSTNYAMRHSNTLYLMDREGYIRAEYPAHRVKPEHVKDDINYLRSE